MIEQKNIDIINSIKQSVKEAGQPSYKHLHDLLDMCKIIMANDAEDLEARDYCLKITKFIKAWCEKFHLQTLDDKYGDLRWECLLFEAPFWFESFLLYMERNRKPKKRFYQPRRKTLKVVVDDLQDLEDGLLDFYGLSLPPRVGKAIAYDTPVLTQNGWKNHGDLTIRDMVIGLDGDFKRIFAIHNPCEMEYEVTFSDGEKIVCHGNHEWLVYNRHSRKCETIETKRIHKKTHDKDGHAIYSLPNKEIVNGIHSPLWVEPYTLGAWLGDGRNTNPDICGAETDYAIVQRIIDAGYPLAWDTRHKTTGVRYYGFRNLRKDLQKYGMCYSRRNTTKHIPDEYLVSDIKQRLDLLAGLLDTDGSLRRDEHRYSFTTNAPILRDDFISLVNTFGWRTSVSRYESGMSSSGIYANKPYWVVSFNPTMHIPCQLDRKKLYEFSKQRRTTIQKVDEISVSTPGSCITVEGGIYCVGRNLKPTHNSSICIFFLAWIIGKRPDSHNAMSGHSGILADRFYNDTMKFALNEEYTFREIFPNVNLVSKSAEKNELYFSGTESFATLTCRGIDGTWTGAVDISSDGYLYVDDLVRDRTESLSPKRLENRFQDYLNVLVDRKNDGSRELMVGTRWNVMDPLGKVESQYKNNPRYRFRKIPALNKEGKSNFEYEYGLGFSTGYYQNIKERLDKNEWEAKYQQNPFIREGLLFPIDALRHYNGVLPEGDHRIVSACDVAWGGGDSLSMPIGHEYENGDVYIPDWVFNKGKKEVTLPIVAGKIMGNEIRQINFEANNGGDMYRKYIDEKLQEWGYKCSCTDSKAPGNMEKMSKIIAYSGDIIRKFVFLDEDLWDEEYRAAMEELTMFVQLGSNEHDDAPDGVTQLARFINSGGIAKATAMKRPF